MELGVPVIASRLSPGPSGHCAYLAYLSSLYFRFVEVTRSTFFANFFRYVSSYLLALCVACAIIGEIGNAEAVFVPRNRKQDLLWPFTGLASSESRESWHPFAFANSRVHKRLIAGMSAPAWNAYNIHMSRRIPRNIYGTITGKWSVATAPPPDDTVSSSALFANVTLSIDGTKKTIQTPRYKVYQLGLHESSGFALVALIQRRAPRLLSGLERRDTETNEPPAENQAAIDVVFGDLLLRDGQYRSPHDRWLNVIGLYSFPDGTLVLFGDGRFRPRGVMSDLYEAYQKLPTVDNRQQPLSMAQFEQTVVEALQPPRSDIDEMNTTMINLKPRQALAWQPDLGPVKQQNSKFSQRPEVSRTSETNEDADSARQDAPSIQKESDPHFDFENKPAALCPVRIALHVEKLSSERESSGHQHTNPGDFTGGILLSVGMEGELDTCDVCRGRSNFVLRLSTADTMRILSAAQKYSLVAILFCVAQIAVMLKQMESTNTQASASKISMFSVGMQAIMDAYMCLMHLVFGVAVQAVFNAFATASFFYFVIFSIFEMRYLLMIWKARSWRANNAGWDSIRRELSLLYSRFYAALLLGVLAVYHMQSHLDILIFGMYSYWLPQIFRTTYLDTRRSFLLPYTLLMSVARLLPPLYFLGCPSNFMHLRPRPRFCVMLVCWTFFQIMWMETQARWGGRWFIPKRFRPPKYEYTRPFAALSQGDCVICMQSLEDTSSSIMVAPCDHAFHSECLLKWMDIKLECPTCRRALPVP